MCTCAIYVVVVVVRKSIYIFTEIPFDLPQSLSLTFFDFLNPAELTFLIWVKEESSSYQNFDISHESLAQQDYKHPFDTNQTFFESMVSLVDVVLLLWYK